MPPTTHQKVLEQLRLAILQHKYLPGDPIRADVVAAELNVSRIPVREALRMLEAEGLVVSRPHKDVTVAELSVADLHEIYMLRRMLETEAVRRAIPALGATTLSELEQTLLAMDEALAAGDGLRFTELNRRFHFALYEASGLRNTIPIINILWSRSDAYRSIYMAEAEDLKHLQAEHHAILRACQARDVDAAIALLDEHRQRAEHGIADILTNIDASSPNGQAQRLGR